MNNAVCIGAIVMFVNTVTTVINLGVYIKTIENNCRCNRKYSRLKKNSNFNRNSQEEYRQFVRCEKNINKNYSAKSIKEFRYLLDEAYQQMQQGQLRYAIYDAYSVLSGIVKMILCHTEGYVSDDLLINIKICERRGMLGDDKEFISKLYEVYHICKSSDWKLDKGKYINHRKVYFVIMQLKDLLNFAEREVVYF